jgi:glycosyltransferase involved in cell wall biosynthesis
MVNKKIKRLKILIIMDPGIMIPLKGYGGHERLVEMFAKEYHKMGHEVHLLITTGSAVAGCTVHDFGKEGFPPKKMDALLAMPIAWKFLWQHRKDFDLVHNLGRLAYLLPILHFPVKKIMTYGREITSRNINLINRLGGKNIWFTACSRDLLSRVSADGNWEVVYNAIEFGKYQLQQVSDKDAPLIFLGRIEKIKGCHTAIEVAKRTGNKLVIAGNISPLPEEQAYYKKYIEPLVDGIQIKYIGSVNDVEKNEWLGKCKALLFPIEWNEPFGIVMIEAMACGTPVLAFNRGSVNEVVEEGITGNKVDSLEEMVIAVNNVAAIDRQQCRHFAEKKYDVSVISRQYIDLACNPWKKIVIITTGQPAANPRVLKEYEALKQNRYQVRVLYTYSAEWSYRIDEDKFNSGKLEKRDFVLVGGNPNNDKIEYFFSRLLFKIFSRLFRLIPLAFFQEITIVRSAFYLWLFARKYKADLYIAHYLGALPAAIKAAAKCKVAVVFDAEDFHRGEEPYYAEQVKEVIKMETRLLPKVNLITTSSPLISKAYGNLFPDKKVITLLNVFDKNYVQPTVDSKDQQLKLFWFSQNIGANRGLEVIIDALNLIDENVSLTLLGNIRNPAYVEELLLRSKKPDKINFLNPVNPEQVFKIASKFDIGLAAEIPYCQNRDICLTNKIFTYLVAGNCILASDTTAQKEFMNSYQHIGSLYRHNDAGDLANKIITLFYDRNRLAKYKKNALTLAQTNLNWEKESEQLLSIVKSLTGSGVK